MDKQTHIPTLRFPEFEGEWELKKLGEVYTFRSTNSYSRENLNYDFGKVKNIHYGDIHTQYRTLFDVTKEKVPFINTDIEIEKIPKENYCKEGDLIIADASEDYADIGKSIEIINLNNEDVLAGLHTLQARPELFEVKIGFSGYLMQSEKVRIQIKTIAQGTKVLGISATRLNSIDLVFPTLPEQTKIANFLSAVDEKLQQLQQQKAHLAQYKKGVMQQIFNQTIRFKDDDGNAFPDWEEKRLGELCTLKKGEQLNVTELTSNGKYPALNGGINPSGYTDKWNTDEDTITISEGGNSCGYVNFIMNKFWCGGHCYALKNIQKFINNLYMFHFLKFVEPSIMKLRVGSGLPNIQKSALSELKIEFPSLPEQTKIANFLSALDEKLTHITHQITLTQQWKKGLLQQLFV